MILRSIASALRRHDWFTVAVEIFTACRSRYEAHEELVCSVPGRRARLDGMSQRGGK